MTNTNTSTIKQQYQEYNNNYNNNIDTHPGVFLITAEDAERICAAYTNAIGSLNGTVAAMIESAVKHGLSVENILSAINETAFAPRPSAAYLRAILRNWLKYGVSTRAAAPKAPSWWQQTNPALQYSQRDTSDYMFNGDDVFEELRKYVEGESKP